VFVAAQTLDKMSYLLGGLTIRLILALAGVGALALRPRSSGSAFVVVAAAALDVGLGAPVGPPLVAVAPMITFLSAALTLAALVERSGLSERAAAVLARTARGSTFALYAATCGLCAALTAVVSLDGAVVLMVPIVLALSRRWNAPLAALFLGVVAVANAASVAVPLGNPTNLVVIDRLGLSAGTFVAHMFVPGVLAAGACAAMVAVRERRALVGSYPMGVAVRAPLSGAERHAAATLAGAALAAWSAALFGVPPWWPFAGAVAVALASARGGPRPIVPWRLATQVSGLLIVTGALNLQVRSPSTPALGQLVAIAVAVGAASALANNLPVSICAAGLLSAGPFAFAALIGLGVGSLATPHGSLATMIAADLAGDRAPRLPLAITATLAIVGVLLATLLLWTAG
jgi:arsenical pump membrane protein